MKIPKVIHDVYTVSVSKPRYLKLVALNFTINGFQKHWELLRYGDKGDRVSTLIYQKPTESFLFHRRFRPPLFVNKHRYNIPHDPPDSNITNRFSTVGSITTELYAIKNIKSAKVLPEITEEFTGCDVCNIKRIFSHTTVGIRHHIFCITVNYDDPVRKLITKKNGEVHVLHQSQIDEFISDPKMLKMPDICFALEWWKRNYVNS